MDLSRSSLKISRIANCDVFVGQGIKTPWERLYGGQTVAQSLLAASHTVGDEYPVHSLHAYFILAGDSTKEILFNVERTRNGGAFMTRTVKAMQDNRTICHTQVSFHREEPGYEFQRDLDEVLAQHGVAVLPPPDAFKGKPTEDTSNKILRHTIAEGKDWRISYVRVASDGLIDKGDWKTNCSMLTFLSDTGMVGAARRPHGDVNWGMSLSLDHVIHFHRPLEICVENWMVVYHSTTVSRGARGLATALAYSLAGALLATFNQEALMRPMADSGKL